jgi:hypothetical protein
MMRVRSFVSFASMVAIASAIALIPVAAAAQAQTPPPTPAKPQETKPEAKPDAKPTTPATAATLAGKWTVTIESPQGTMESTLDMKADPKDAKKVGGSMVSQLGESVIEGEVVDGKLTFWFTINAGGGDLSVTFAGTLQKEGGLAGTLNFGQGDVNWTAVRVKG